MIETLLDNLRKSFHETRERGGLYGIVTDPDRYGNHQFLRVSWVDYTAPDLGGTLFLVTQNQNPQTLTNGLEALTALLSELRVLRQEAGNEYPARRL